jgi:putative FmdB family regulatory protein
MPIYAYKCGSCGHAKDVLQKISDAPLTTCPSCGAESFSKQVTAAGFQLKGSGWYVTDFRGGNTSNGAAGGPSSGTSANAPASDAKSDSKSEPKSESKSDTKPADTGSSSSSKSDAPSAAGGCGASCACH